MSEQAREQRADTLAHRESRVRGLRAMVAAGHYQVPAFLVAERMVATALAQRRREEERNRTRPYPEFGEAS